MLAKHIKSYSVTLIGIVLLVIVYITWPSSAYSLQQSRQLPECEISTNCVRIDWEVENVEDSFNKVIKIIDNTIRTEVTEQTEDYIHAEVRSKIMKYVDDLEIIKNNASGKLQLRSASRLGSGDFGVNKKRIVDILNQLETN